MADEIEMDPTTGLPAIPGDHYWTVQPRSNKTYEVLLMRRPARGTWGLEDVCVDQSIVMENVLFPGENRHDEVERELAVRAGLEAGWAGPDLYKGVWCITNTRLTAERIALTAKRIMVRFNEAERVKHLVGNYPPNILKRDSE